MKLVKHYQCPYCGVFIKELKINLSKKYLENFIKLCALDKPMKAKDIKSLLGIDNIYLTNLRKFNLVYKDKITQKWSVTKFGQRFYNNEIPCPRSIITKNNDITEEFKPMYLKEMLNLYEID